jgi:hypothetical protein
MQRRLIFILLAVVTALIAIPAGADEAIIYDSGLLAINSWHVHLSNHTIHSDRFEKGYVNVKKNTPGLKINAGFLILNHQPIPLINFFRKQDTTFKKKISLKRTNRLGVFLTGAPGASITITLQSEAPYQPPPIVAFDANPKTIIAGSASSLSWSCDFADSCSIEPDIGSVGMRGSIIVSPASTTTYRIGAAGPGGAAAASVTVTVKPPPPTVVLTATPSEIVSGESATLTWSTAHADSVFINQRIGAVQANGTLVVNPSADTTYTITVKGPGGISSAEAAIKVISPISIQIIAPADNEAITHPDTMVRGTFSNTPGKETGIAVNGKVAMISGNQFVVNHLPLQQGTNIIKVRARDASGNLQTVTEVVSATLPEHHIEISANIESGSSPLELGLHVVGTFAIEDSVLTYDGPGEANIHKDGNDKYRVSLADEGIYGFTVKVIHETATFMDSIAVVVINVAEIDALLQQKWADMKSKLGSGDIAGALEYFPEGIRPLFDYNFNLLNDHLNEIIASMQNIQLVKIEDDRAEYNLIGDQGGQSFSFYLLFQKTGDGIWKIVNF